MGGTSAINNGSITGTTLTNHYQQTPQWVYQAAQAIYKPRPILSGIRCVDTAFNAMCKGNSIQEKDTPAMWDDLFKIICTAKAVINGAPSKFAQMLLFAGTPKGLSFTNCPTTKQALFIMRRLGFLIEIPAIPKLKKRYHRLGMNGVRMVEHWRETNPKFQRYYDAFLDKDYADFTKSYFAELGLGITPSFLQEHQKKIDAALKRLNDENIALNRQLATTNHGYMPYTGGLPVASTVPSTGALQVNANAALQVYANTWYDDDTPF